MDVRQLLDMCILCYFVGPKRADQAIGAATPRPMDYIRTPDGLWY